MKRFVLPCPPDSDGRVRLYENDYHYLVRVRRLTPGSYFDAVFPGGKETRIRVLSIAGNILTGECLEAADDPPLLQPPVPPVALFQGLPKGAKMDLIVRQAAESGVSIVAPFESEYSTARLAKHSEGGKTGRWERIVREARQQSGSATETLALAPCGFDALLEYWEAKKKEYLRPVGIVLHQEPLEKGAFHDYLNNSPDFVALAVGPEGGFSPEEVSRLLAAGFKPLVMGNTILRTETAALYGIAAIRTILLESESWTSKE